MKSVFLLLTCFLLTGCTQSFLMFRESKNVSALKEMLFRRVMVGPKGKQVWFIDYGHGKDPPKDFLKRFSDLPDLVKNISEMEKDKRGIIDPETGKNGYIVKADIRWIDEYTAEFQCSAWHGADASINEKGVAYFFDGKWILKIKSAWVS
jgi:hypothetical protein